MLNNTKKLGMLIIASGVFLFPGVAVDVNAQTEGKSKANPAVPTFKEAAKKAMELEMQRKTARRKKEMLRRRAGGPNANKPTIITVTFQQPYGVAVEISEEMARLKLYEMAAGECDRITTYFPGFCYLTRFNVQNFARRGTQAINASATFTISK